MLFSFLLWKHISILAHTKYLSILENEHETAKNAIINEKKQII